MILLVTINPKTVTDCTGFNVLCIKQQSYKFSFDLWKIDCGQILTLSDHPPSIPIPINLEARLQFNRYSEANNFQHLILIFEVVQIERKKGYYSINRSMWLKRICMKKLPTLEIYLVTLLVKILFTSIYSYHIIPISDARFWPMCDSDSDSRLTQKSDSNSDSDSSQFSVDSTLILIPSPNPWFQFNFHFILIFLIPIPIPIPAKIGIIPESIPIPESCITDSHMAMKDRCIPFAYNQF